GAGRVDSGIAGGEICAGEVGHVRGVWRKGSASSACEVGRIGTRGEKNEDQDGASRYGRMLSPSTAIVCLTFQAMRPRGTPIWISRRSGLGKPKPMSRPRTAPP